MAEVFTSESCQAEPVLYICTPGLRLSINPVAVKQIRVTCIVH